MSAVASPIDVPQYQEQCDAMTLPPPPPENFCLRPMRYNYEAKRPSPPAYPAESTLHHDLEEHLLGPERIINNEAWITHSASVHDRKFYKEERDWQPKHPMAPSLTRVHYIRPDTHLKIQGVAGQNMRPYNPFPNHISESKASFTPHYAEPALFGQAGIFITDRFVHMPENRVNVIPAFSYDDMFSVLRKAHPYMTTYRLYHKNFEDELPQHKFLDSLMNLKTGPAKAKPSDSDCAVKLIMRPMLDPFEQTMSKLNMLPSLTHKRENPGDPRNFAHLKHFFRVPPSNTAYPRVHPPVPHMGMNTTYNDFYDRPLHPNMALNHCQDEKFCFVQPRMSASGLMRVPEFYRTENEIYGSGRNVSSYIDNDPRDSMRKAQEFRDEQAFKASEAREKKGCLQNKDGLLAEKRCSSPRPLRTAPIPRGHCPFN